MPWAVETSNDQERWRSLGKGWSLPGEPLLIHGLSRYLRFRDARDANRPWSGPLERTGDEPITLLNPEDGTRQEIWPTAEHMGLPVLLPGGEVGRLLRFDRLDDGERWTWALEFKGERRART